MLINSRERLITLFDAQREFREFHGKEVPESFYLTKLAEVWRRASGVPAYQEIGDFSWSAFTTLAATEKGQVKEAPWNFVATSLDTCAKYYETTGTTGKVTPTPRLADDLIWNIASVADAWRDVIGPDDRALSLLPSDIVPVGDMVTSVCEMLDVPHTRAYPFATGVCDWDRLVTVWDTLRPTVVFLAPGVALQATRLLKQRGLLPRLRESVRSLMLLGEVSVPALRARLGQWWNGLAYDASYGSTETGTLAAACPADRLHLLTTANYFEVAVGDRLVPLSEADTGRLVVTPLNLHARPLLRYDTGDDVRLDTGCVCGHAAPVVEILGRAADGLRIGGSLLSPNTVEQVVYGHTTATGYLLEADREGRHARLLLERDVDADRGREPAMSDDLQAASRDRLGLTWDQVLFVNTLPSSTKSGGSQKSWKRSNIRIVETW